MKKLISVIVLLCPLFMMGSWKSKAEKLIKDFTGGTYSYTTSPQLASAVKNHLLHPDTKKNAMDLLNEVDKRIDKQEDNMKKFGSVKQRGHGQELYLSNLLEAQTWLRQGLRNAR